MLGEAFEFRPEGEPRQVEHEHREPIDSGVFIGGATSKMKGLGGIDNVLKIRFGSANVTTYNSLLSPEWSDPNRFVDMGKDLRKKMEKGSLTVIAHSFGAAEVYAAMATDPEFFQDPKNLENLQLIFISPVLPKNLREGIGIGVRYGRIGVQEGGVFGGKTLPGKTRNLHGIASTGILPVEGVPFAAVQEQTRETSPEISHISRGTSNTIIEFTDQRDYRSVLNAEERIAINKNDTGYVEAMNGLREGKSNAIYRRGIATHTTLSKINQNDWSEFGDTAMQGTHNKLTWKTVKMTGKLLKDTFAKGIVYDMTILLAEAGVRTKVVVPEFDTLITSKQAGELNKVKNIDVIIAAHTTHGFPWADQPELLLKLLDHQGQDPDFIVQ